MLGEIYDCEPTLTDQQVIEFCKNGFMMLEAVVPDEVNRRTTEFVNRNPENEPIEIMDGWLARIAMNDLGLRNTIMKRRGELKLRLSKWLFEREEIGEARAIYRDAVFDDEYLGRNVRGRLMFHFPGLWRSFRAAKQFAGV